MRIRTLSAVLAAALLSPSAIAAEFAYRGNLDDAGQPAEGTYDLQVSVYGSERGGKPIGAPIVVPGVMVSEGRFAVAIELDDALVQGGTRWLELAVREAGSKEGFDVLPAREKAVSGTTSVCTGAWDLGGNAGITPGSYLGTADNIPLELRANNVAAITVTNAGASNNIAVAGDIQFTRTADRELSVGKEPDNNSSGKALTISAGDASDSGIPFQARPGGDLVLQAGNGYNASIAGADGGDVIIRSGANWIMGNTLEFSGGDIVLQTGGQTNAFTERMRVKDTGEVSVAILGAAGATTLCRNASNQIATCSSSARYKDHVVDADYGLETIAALRPVRFEWKETHAPDLGLVAEEVAGIEPALTTRNEAGEVEGVKYDRLAAVLVKAMQEQQAQLAQQRAEIASLQQEQQRLVQLLQQLTTVGGSVAAEPASGASATTVAGADPATGGTP